MPPHLTTPRLQLRLRDGSDAAWNLTLLAEDPSAPTRSLADESARLDGQRAAAERDGFGLYTVLVSSASSSSSPVPVGYCGLIVGRGSLTQPELAYELLRPHVGNGYATEAAAAVTSAAFEAGFPVLWATVEVWNAPSFGVLRKLGFERRRRASGEGGKVLVWMRGVAPRGRHRAG